ncbi:MAG: hypothetical protein HN382_08175 [Gammaproteobacteria bacterium]|nr:hypothetical protein [Gammaproteobacteria bacterium]MBT6081023.1 hypothetical protein [Gammaproteobacteria bacterium]MBT7024353.1 hypothetical protein [Gammaproteobacteria bacterium]
MLLFKIGGDTYGVKLVDVDEVLHMPTLRSIPSAPLFLAGVLNLRGALIPVIDMLERLGQHRMQAPPPLGLQESPQSPYPAGTRLLLTADGDFRFAVIMDGWQGIRELDEQSYREGILTELGKSPFINGINIGDEGMIQRVLLRKLLHDEERSLLLNQQGEK